MQGLTLLFVAITSKLVIIALLATAGAAVHLVLSVGMLSLYIRVSAPTPPSLTSTLQSAFSNWPPRNAIEHSTSTHAKL